MKKKLILILMTVLCMTAAVWLSGCGDKVTYYTLTYSPCVGVTYESEVLSGAQVKKGYTVKFRVHVDPEKAMGEPSVRVNDRTVSPQDGEYSFTMVRDTTVSVEGVYRRGQYSVTFDEGDYRTKYTDLAGNPLTTLTAETDSTVKFRIKQSAYYVGTPVVLANTIELQAATDAGGAYYSFDVTGNTTVKTTNLEIDTPYVNRPDGGQGTAEDPFIINRPIDLYYMADSVANEMNTVAPFSHYRMTADIDMRGEQLYIIGDGTVQKSMFSGVFDGGGHTISDFFITDYIIEQQNFTSVKLPYVGLFGIVGANSEGNAQIANVHLRDFRLEADRTEATGLCTVGPLVGYAMGADIVGCSASGCDLHIVGSANQETHAGGLVGVMQSYYSDFGMRYPSSVRSCYSDVSVEIKQGLGMTAGGLIGYLRTIERDTAATVLNSYATGDVAGAIYSGGLIGMTTLGVAVENSYATGDVAAYSPVDFTTGTGDDRRTFTGIEAYAGGLIGYLEHSSVAYACVAVGETSATVAKSANTNVGSLVGKYGESGAYYIEDTTAFAYRCHTGDDVHLSDNGFFASLGWSDTDWVFENGKLPTIRFEDSSLAYDITVRHIGSGNISTFSVVDRYLTMYDWHTVEGGVPRTLTEGHLRSYGYYFDEEKALPVPEAFVPVGEVTLYAGFADGRDLVGVYYLPTPSGNSYVAGSDKTYLRLHEDGRLMYRNDSITGESYYLYDGTYIWLYDVLLAEHFSHADAYAVGTFRAEVKNGVMTVHDLYSLLVGDAPVTAYAEDEGFKIGTYYRTDGATYKYVFYRDGTGATIGTQTIPFTYTRDGDTVNIRPSMGAEVRGTIENGVLTHFNGNPVSLNDVFAGVWEAETTDFTEYEFDGAGNWQKSTYVYAEGKKVCTEAESGTYATNGYAATLSDGKTVELRDNMLYIDDVLYTAPYSYRGEWVYSHSVGASLSLYGIASDGLGKGVLDFGTDYGAYDVTYAYTGDEIVVHYGNIALARLSYDTTDHLLRGSLYSFKEGRLIEGAMFAVYDEYLGTWVSDDDTLDVLRFDGLGSYDVAGSEDKLAVRGHVVIGDDTVQYRVTRGTDRASFTYKGVEYALSFGDDGFPHLTADDVDIVLYRRDRLYGVVLIDGDGGTYAFDGKSAHGHGTLTYTPADGESVTRTYDITGDVISVEGTALTISDYGYVYGDAVLTRKNLYSGDWLVGATEGGALHIGALRPYEQEFRAIGTYLDKAVTFTYDEASGDLTFVFGDEAYVLAAQEDSDAAVVELSLTYASGATAICIRRDASYIDEYCGKYTAKNANTRVRSLYLDGFSGNYFGAGGTALIEEQSESGALLHGAISYMYDDYGHIVFHTQGNVQYVFVEAQDGEYVREGSEKTYDLREKDILYNRVVYYKNIRNEIVFTETYRFDGIGTMYFYREVTSDEGTTSEQSATYAYEIIEQNEDDRKNNRYRLSLTDGQGKTVEAILGYGESVLTLSFDREEAAD